MRRGLLNAKRGKREVSGSELRKPRCLKFDPEFWSVSKLRAWTKEKRLDITWHMGTVEIIVANTS